MAAAVPFKNVRREEVLMFFISGLMLPDFCSIAKAKTRNA
jgi:hypothetical protein